MMENGIFLRDLARQILATSESGVSKVKLAKLIYLTHKWLIQNDMAKKNDLEYIRMPLGPVPSNFGSISKDPAIEIREENVGLSYNRVIFFLKKKYVGKIERNGAEEVIIKLNKFPTSTLVNYTHSEPSWMKHVNGSVYKISKQDIKRPILKLVRKRNITKENDSQRLQGHLVNGMIDEIVDTSTSLEYPEDD